LARKKLTLVGPMSSAWQGGIPEFNRIAAILRHEGYTVLNPAEYPTGLTYEVYVTKGLYDVREADGVALVNNWEDSHGAKLQRDLARSRYTPAKSWRYWYWTSVFRNRPALW
jgi:hypothetical protein